MPCIVQCYIMRIAIKGGLFVLHLHITKDIPAHQSVGKLKRTVFYHLGIQSAVGSEVDIFKENAVHRRLNSSSRLCVYRQFVLRIDSACHQR